MAMWPNFRSPLVWDVFAVSTYATVSFLFWFIGLIPDLATLRDRSQSRIGRVVYGMLAMGWRGSARHWYRYETAYLLLAGLSTPLVVSVHTIVSFDFAVSIIPGWHATIFPPYFVAGAIYAGFAMVLTIAIPLRKFYGLEDFITMRHLNNMARVMLATGLFVAYGYMMEAFMAWYSANPYEQFMMTESLRRSVRAGVLVAACSATSWCRSCCGSSACAPASRRCSASRWSSTSACGSSASSSSSPACTAISCRRRGACTTRRSGTGRRIFGTIGLFLSLLFLFIRFLPMISIFEMRTLLPEAEVKEDA